MPVFLISCLSSNQDGRHETRRLTGCLIIWHRQGNPTVWYAHRSVSSALKSESDISTVFKEKNKTRNSRPQPPNQYLGTRCVVCVHMCDFVPVCSSSTNKPLPPLLLLASQFSDNTHINFLLVLQQTGLHTAQKKKKITQEKNLTLVLRLGILNN